MNVWLLRLHVPPPNVLISMGLGMNRVNFTKLPIGFRKAKPSSLLLSEISNEVLHVFIERKSEVKVMCVCDRGRHFTAC
jgi:hypothetical protein